MNEKVAFSEQRRLGRLSAALRENLKRRKAQARGRAAASVASPEPSAGEDTAFAEQASAIAKDPAKSDDNSGS
jgi:hypothetical protein